jgi:integrase/recombinase XerD
VTSRAAISKRVDPHTLRHAFITTMRYDRACTSLDRHATHIIAAFIAGAAR